MKLGLGLSISGGGGVIIPQYSSICCVGTSITDGGTAADVVDGQTIQRNQVARYTGWLQGMLNHRIAYPFRAVGGEAPDWDYGYSGARIDQLLAGISGRVPVADAYAANANLYILEGGTNDVVQGSTAATTIQRITDYWSYFRSRGKPVVAVNVPPVGPTYGATVRDAIIAVNAALPAIAATLGVRFIDIHRLATLDVDGYMTTASSGDQLHPNPAYSQRIAQAIADTIIANVSRLAEPVIPAVGSGQWISSNPSPSQNTIPSGWSVSGPSSIAYSAITDSDGTTWQRITASNTTPVNLDISGNTLSGFAPGDRVRMCARIRGVSGSFVNVPNISVYFNRRVSGVTSLGANVLFFQAATVGAGSSIDPFSGLFMSPEYVLPEGTDRLLWYLNPFAIQNISFDIRQFGVFKVS